MSAQQNPPLSPSSSSGRRGHFPTLLLELLLGTLFLVGCDGRLSVTPTTGGEGLQQTVITVIKQVQPSVVEVRSQSEQGGAIGSGEIISPDGYIVTNDHVVADFTTFAVRLANNQATPAQLVGEDPKDDLAVLKIAARNLQPIQFADSSQVQVGQFSIAVGNPLGLQETATFGIVSALNRIASEGPNGPAHQLTGLIQTSAPINPGNSGGALVDLHGQLIGIPTLTAVDPEIGVPAPGIGFAIPSNRVKIVVQELLHQALGLCVLSSTSSQVSVMLLC